MRTTRRWWLVLAGALATTVGLTAEQQWPQFRGSSDGVAADDARLPETWSQDENVAWKIDIPGRGWGSPVVWGSHVFVVTAIDTTKPVDELRPVREYIAGSLGGTMTGADINRDLDEHRWVVYDVDLATGRTRWERVVRTGVPAETTHQKNSFASETPVTDGERVYVYLAYAGLFAFDFDGHLVWSKPMDTPPMRMGWGPAASPALHDGRLYFVNDNEKQSFIAAFDARTGDELWRVNRDEGSNWSTPFVWQNERRTEIVTTGTNGVKSYDTGGHLLWQLHGMTSLHAATPIAADGLLYVSSGYPIDRNKPVYAIKPGASGDISLAEGQTSNAFIVWSDPRLAASYPSGLVVDDAYYMLLDRGFLTANDARTGQEIYGRQRLATDGGTFSASPWSYNGKIFAINEEGATFVVQAGPEFELVGRNDLDEMTLATPAVADGSLIIRTASKLYRIGR